MKFQTLFPAMLATAAILAPASTLACGEGQFNMGQGLRYQGYLAPRPAAVLVYADSASGAERKELYQGLEQAGHRVTVVTDAASLSRAMAANHFDVVIANFGQIDAVESSTSAAAVAKPLLLPIVARSARNEPELRSRFSLFLIEGASLGQYLKVINQAVRLP